jgi:hypothetical protein
MKALFVGVLLVGCTSEPATGPANITVSTGFQISSAYSLRGSDLVAFAGRASGTPCADLEKARMLDEYHDALVVERVKGDGTYPIGDVAGGASLKIFDDCVNGSVSCYDAAAAFHSGSITVRWGEDAVTGTIDAHGSSAQTPDLVVSGIFEAPYCH